MAKFYKKISCEYCDTSKECLEKDKWNDFMDLFWSEHEDCMTLKYLYKVTIRKGGGEKFI